MSRKLPGFIIQKGLVQALGVSLYCGLIGIVLWQGNTIFGQVSNYFGPVAFLLLFSVSALTCGLIVFYKPYRLFLDGLKQEAIDLVLTTTAWLFIFFLLTLLFAITIT